MSEWISLDERVPEPNQTVIVSDGDAVGCLVYRSESRWHVYGSTIPCDQAVTHWMPLPEAPND